jgi:hypothetical protein
MTRYKVWLDRHGGAPWLVASVVWLGALTFSISTYTVLNDHFERISRARQIARYGALPFRDFFDPGYFMTEFSSAALQLLLGDNLLGEMLLDTVFIASGITIVFLLSRRISGSNLVGLGAGLLALLSMPRAYDFDKVLFYPLGIALCWHYVDRPGTRRAMALGAGIAIAALFRYDTGIYIGCAAVVAASVLHWREPGVLARRIGLCAATAALCWLAVVVPIVGAGNVEDAIDQLATYAVREKARTEISRAPRFSLGRAVGRVVPHRATSVTVRWSESTSEPDRLEAESRYRLHLRSEGYAPGERTRHYTMADPSPTVIRELLRDSRAEDTAGLDRARQALPEEPLWVRAQRTFPVLQWRVLPDAWNADNATAFIYYLLWVLPLVGAVGAVSARKSPWVTAQEVARLGAVVVVCLALNIFVLRHPVGARIGGIAGPVAILAVWVGARSLPSSRLSLRLRVTLAGVLAGVLALAVISIASLTAWPERLVPQMASPSHLRSVIARVSASPPKPDIIPSAALAGMVQYVRECTSPADKLLARWFVPELYFFSQRAFAAGMVVTFSGHWSEPRFEIRSVRALASESVPIVIERAGDAVGTDYPLLTRFIKEHYRVAGQTSFGSPDPENYTVLVRTDRAPARSHPTTGMPCFH